MDMRRTFVLHTASVVVGVLVFCVAALLLAQQARAQSVPEPPCTTNFCIDKTANPLSVAVGEQITFTITERCPIALACGTTYPISDTLPAGLTLVSVEDNLADALCTAIGNTVECTGIIRSTPTAPFTLTIVATATECGTFTNTASSANSSGSVTYTVVGCPPSLPTTKEQCKKGGYREFGYPDQGTCISDVNRRAGRT
jgi:fimbrial isopeptide formation D2 family protein